MSSRRYQPSLHRQQSLLLPPSVEEYVSETNNVRAIEAYVETLDLLELGFSHTQAKAGAGQPPYNPAALLKLYIYGYLQGLRSSRKLERETHRNLEVIWLVEGVRPSYKTIADFRKGNGPGLKRVNRDFILLCRELALLGGEEVGVDGSFFKADASKGSIDTEAKLSKQLERLESHIAAYQQALAEQDAADDKAGKGSLVEDAHLREKLRLLEQRQAAKKAQQQALKDSGEKQLSHVDKDARLLSKRGQTIAGYNVQIAVDSEYKLIVAEEVTQDGNDTQQLAPMLEKAQAILHSEDLTGLADSGYYEGHQLKRCEEQDITVYVAIPDKSKKLAGENRFTRAHFTYDDEDDVYHCPQGKSLRACGKSHQKNNKWLTRYVSKVSDCKDCPVRSQCLTEKAGIKQLQRWEHEAVVERHRERMQGQSQMMRKRGAIVEHPIGTLKNRAGKHHFLMRGLEKCRGEFSLMVLGYNFTRVLNILGTDFIRNYCARRQGNAVDNVNYA